MFQNKDNSDLVSNILFEGVSPEILQTFTNPSNTIGKKEGAVIYQKGDLTDFVYLVIEGTVKIKFTEPDGTNNYFSRSKNSFFGETELLGKAQRKSSAVADTDCRMFTLNINELKVLIKKDKQILRNLFIHKTIDVLEEDFIEMTKEFIDPETDFSEFTKTTEKIAVNNDNIEEEPPAVEEEKTSEDEQGAFDNIITKEEIDEDSKPSENISEEEIIKEDDSIVIDNIEDEPPVTEDEKTPEDEQGAFDNIITKEEVDEDSEPPENISEEEIIKEDDGFTIEETPAVDFSNPAEIEAALVEDEPKPEAIDEEVEEEEIPAAGEQKKMEADFSDYYETLLNATQNIFSKITIDETAEAIAGSATKLVNATGGVLYTVDKENEELKAKILTDSSIKDIRIKFSDGLQGKAVIEKRSIIPEDPKEDKDFNPVIEDLTGIKIKNVIYYPIMTKSEEAIAVLELYNSERGKFDSREIELLNAISPSIQRALGNARYVDVLVHQRKILSLGEITDFISDDIKSTLLKVKHYSSLLKKKDLSPEANKLLEIQIGQINSIEDFLKFTDAYAHGKNVTEKSTIKVSEAVTQILNFLAEYVDSRNTVIYKKIDEDAVINVDLPAIYLVCYQIAKNACDAMNDNGKIFVTTERDGKYIKINFRDTGVGISETIKGKLFKPFVSYAKKQRPGLGLAIAERLISDQDGYIMTESVLGEGSTFSIALPVVF